MKEREQVSITVSKTTHRLIKHVCKHTGYKVFGLVDRCVEEWCKNNGFNPETILNSQKEEE